jgi:predicted GH43/DUF377 family glycosyl hydrolase
VVELSRNFEPCGKPQLIKAEPGDETIQDARMVQLGEKILLFFNKVDSEERTQKMFLAELSKRAGEFELQKIHKLRYVGALRKIEKNWSPFVHKERLYAIYQISPHTVLEVDPESGLCKEVAKGEKGLEWSFGALRGGTPAISLGEEYLTLFHSSKVGLSTLWSKKGGRVFFMGAYLFAARPPFAITQIAERPLGNAELYEGNPKNVVYPGGVVMEGEKIYVAWGKDDREICITTLERTKLLHSLKPPAL